jgi:hypothetical protein
MTINGSDFFTTDYEAYVTYMGVTITGTIVSDNQITVDWSSIGLPISSEEV